MDREFVFGDDAPFASCHAATVAEVPDGEVAAWFGGTKEGAADVAIWLARRGRRGWSDPVVVADADQVPCWNPVLHLTSANELLLFYKAGSHPQTWSGFLRRSHDLGASWADEEMLPAGILGPVKNKPLELADGTLVCGTSVESYRSWGSWVERTDDGGRSWSKHGPIVIDGQERGGSIQPALVGHGEHLAMLCRTRGVGSIVRSSSADGGRHWTPLRPVELPHNNSGLDAVTLADGRVVLAYNHCSSGRTPLNLAVSADLGLSWQPSVVLEGGPGEYSYPAIIESRDKTSVHVVYTWRRERIASVKVAISEL